MSAEGSRKVIAWEGPVPEKLKQKPEKKEEKPFKVGEMRKEANEIIDGLKRNIYGQNLNPAEVSKAWQSARFSHDRISAALNKYNSATPHEKKELAREVNKRLIELKGWNTDWVHDVVQDKAVKQDRPKGKLRHGEDSLSERNQERLVSAIQSFNYQERRIQEIRGRIKELEEAAKPGRTIPKRNQEPEILQLEDELRTLEREIKGLPPKEKQNEMTPSRTIGMHQQSGERARDTAYEKKVNEEALSVSNSYEGDAHYPLPAPLNLEKVEVQDSEVPSSPETAVENKMALRRSVEGVQDLLAERAGVKGERDAMHAASERYFEAQKNLYKSGMGKADSGPEVEEAADAERAYTKARSAYASALEGSSTRRIGEKGLSGEKAKALQERYDRAIRAKAVFNEIIKPASELKTHARLEGLSQKGQSIFQKGLGVFAGLNQRFENWAGGKNKARVYRAAATAILLTAGAAAVGSFGTAGILAATGYGAYRFTRSLGGSIFGAGVGGIAGKLYQKRGRRKQAGAVAELSTAGRGKLNVSEGYLATIDAQRERLMKAADEGTLARNTNWVRAIAALTAGAGASGALAELGVLHHAAAASLDQGGIGGRSSSLESHGVEGTIPQAQVVHAGVAIEHPEKLHLEIGTHHGQAHNMEQLTRHFQKQLRTAGYSADDPKTPPGIRAFLAEKPHHFANDYNFHSEADHESARVFAGDGIKVDANGNVLFTPKGGESITLIDGSGDPQEAFNLGGHATIDPTEHHPVAHSASVEPSSHEPVSRINDVEQTQELNNPQLHPSGASTPVPEAAPAQATHAQPESTRASSGNVTYLDMEGNPTGKTPPLVSMDEAIKGFQNHAEAAGTNTPLPFETANGTYLPGVADADAQTYANSHGASVFVNRSFNQFGGSRVVQVYEYKPEVEKPELHTTSDYDIAPPASPNQ